MKTLKAVVNALDRKSHINPEIYGHFSEHLGRCIYNGIYVGEDSDIPNTCGIRNDIIEAFRDIKLPVLRWPGGCFADEYHWKDGIGPKDQRKKMINTNWGGVSEDNSFGTHEFMKLCELVGCEPYIAGNLGSGTVQELSEWVEYMTQDGGSPMSELRKANGQEQPWKLKYLGIGNENWGCGGSMRPQYYADEYRRYQSFCKNLSGNELFKIACGPSGDDYTWTEEIMKNLNTYHTKGIALHYYTVPDWASKGFATEFDTDAYYKVMNCAYYMEELLTRHTEIMNRYDPNNQIGLIVDEWGCWYEVEPGTHPGFLYQQNTMRDAMVAAFTLNVLNQHSKRVVMANLAQVVNVLQALVLTEGEKILKTPTYHVFDLFQTHQNSDLVYSWMENENSHGLPTISQSVSVAADGSMTMTLANCDLEESFEISCEIMGMQPQIATARILTDEVHAHNTFEAPETVKTQAHEVELSGNQLKVVLPPCSVVSVCLK